MLKSNLKEGCIMRYGVFSTRELFVVLEVDEKKKRISLSMKQAK